MALSYPWLSCVVAKQFTCIFPLVSLIVAAGMCSDDVPLELQLAATVELRGDYILSVSEWWEADDRK